MKAYHSFSSKETQMLAAVIAEKIVSVKPSRAAASVIALQGDLGAGKTTFTQGFLKALGVKGRVTSPTFVLMKRFTLGAAAKKRGFNEAYHIDAYRFRATKEASALGLKEILENPKAIVLIEWPERLKGMLPKHKTTLRFAHGKKENERIIKVS